MLCCAVLPNTSFPADVTIELEDIVDAVNTSRTIVANPFTTILRRRYRPQLVISILIPIFQQWVGINAIIFYAPRELAGSGVLCCGPLCCAVRSVVPAVCVAKFVHRVRL